MRENIQLDEKKSRRVNYLEKKIITINEFLDRRSIMTLPVLANGS